MINLTDYPVSIILVAFAFMISGFFAWMKAIITSDSGKLMTMAETENEVNFIYSYDSGYLFNPEQQKESRDKLLTDRATELRKLYEQEINRCSNEINEIDHVLDKLSPKILRTFPDFIEKDGKLDYQFKKDITHA